MRRFETLPEGYEVRKPNKLAASTLRSSPPKKWVGSALNEIAEAGCWTEWGWGHHDANVQNALESRGLIEMARPAKRGRLLFRATPYGIGLLNKARKVWGKPPLLTPGEPHEHVYGEPRTELRGFNTFVQVSYCDCGAFRVTSDRKPDDAPTVGEFSEAMQAIDPAAGARGETWPENLGTWALHDAIMAEPDRDRLDMLNAELAARLG